MSGMAEKAEKSRTYRNWLPDEDAKLVEALVNMVNVGLHKADNGFISGYLQHLELALKESLPDRGILGKPHIESRIKTMKKDWQVVYDMVAGTNTSGFGYDAVNKCGTVSEPAVWESYVAINKGAAKWRNKPFPHYEDLCIVFGKDRAQGDRVRDVIEMENEANMEEQAEYTEGSHDTNATNTSTIQGEEVSSGQTKKRNRTDSIAEGIISAAASLGKDLLTSSEMMCQSLNAERDLQDKISKVSSEIFKMESMSMRDKFKASRKIMRGQHE
ncbi:uncharacterized protein [Rutidosis leptorrhynchoides]|uniref:uncharacterized protein n=1 Tax=Rutidosis leptorrhynchoides TaxID=125765 RepID=UPI003A997489